MGRTIVDGLLLSSKRKIKEKPLKFFKKMPIGVMREDKMSNLAIKRVEELEQTSEGTKWLVEGLWLNEGIGILAAQPKTGKSWLAMDVAVSVASGTKCLNKFTVNGAHKVLIFFAEDTESIQRERIELIKRAKGVMSDLDNLGVVVADKGLRLDLPEGVEALRALVAEHRPTLLILDPFVRLHQISESDSTAVAKVLQELRNLKNEFNTGVLLVHHATKGSKNIRGSTEFPAWGETNLFMYKDKAENVFLDIQHRAAESTNAVPLKIGELNDGTSIHVIEEHKAALTLVPDVVESLQSKILGAIRSYSTPRTLEQIVQRVGASQIEVRNELYQLIKGKEIQWTSKGYKTL
jgi:AAA domain